MQLLLLGLAAAIFLHDDAFPTRPTLTQGWPEATVPYATAIGVKLLIVLLFAWQARRTQQQLGKPNGFRALARLDRYLAVLPFALLAAFAADLWLGVLELNRQLLGDLVLIDEVLTIFPTVLALLACWWLHHPVDRRLREATLMRRADEGLPVYPLLTRGQYVTQQLRQQVAVLLVPLLILMAWTEAVQLLAQRGVLTFQASLWITPLGAAAMFLFIPPLLTRIFDTVPLPPGSIRDTLEQQCEQHRIRVANLLLWRTGGHLINAAVMGLVPRLRYVLLTDGLLDQLHRPHVQAVMAHELGHVKHKHLVWLVVFAGLLLGGLFTVADVLLNQFNAQQNPWLQGVSITAALLAWAYAFGWVSRRIERQADTFAAKHMSQHPDEPAPDPLTPLPANPEHFTPAGVSHVVAALGRVAELNHLRPNRPSWRHGSIAKRQDYLLTLIDQPLANASVDRTMNALKAFAFAAILTTLVLAWIT